MNYDQFNDLLQINNLTEENFVAETGVDFDSLKSWKDGSVPSWVSSWLEYRRRAFLNDNMLNQLSAIVDALNGSRRAPLKPSSPISTKIREDADELGPVCLRGTRNTVNSIKSWMERHLDSNDIAYQRNKRVGTRMFDFAVLDANGNVNYVIEVQTLGSDAQIRRMTQLCHFASKNYLTIFMVFELEHNIYMVDSQSLINLNEPIENSLRNPSKITDIFIHLGTLDRYLEINLKHEVPEAKNPKMNAIK